MSTSDIRIRATMLAAAATLVAAAMFALASYSGARFEAALAAAEQRYGADATEVAIAPSRIDVVARRSARNPGVVSTLRVASPG